MSQSCKLCRLRIQAVYTCTRPCPRPCTSRVHGRYTARTRPSTRPSARSCTRMCTGRKHGRALQAVYTCHIHTRTLETERAHSRVRAMLARSCIGRVHDRACSRPVYTPVYMAHVHVNTARVHSRVHGHLTDRVHGRVRIRHVYRGCEHGRIHVNAPYTAPTGRLHGL